MSERRKRTWKEIDQARDGRGPRRVEHLGTDPRSVRGGGKSYMAELNRLFDHGEASDRLKKVMKDAGPDKAPAQDPPERIKLVRQIRAAQTFQDFLDGIDALREQYGLPNDVDVLTRALEHTNESVVSESLTLLLDLTKRCNMTQLKAILARLSTIETVIEDPKILKKATALREKL
jgi:hypothetical protein